MTPWNFAIDLKEVVLDFSYLSFFLVIGTLLRRYVPFFRKFLIPNNIIAGFVALILGPQILGTIWHAIGFPNFAFIPLESKRLGIYVYHLLAITFVTMGLRKGRTKTGRHAYSKAMISILSYMTQAIVGLLIAFILIYTIRPNLFPGIGVLLTMGYGMGPGLAYSIGHGWEQYGFIGGGEIGLTLAAIGYLFAFFGGIGLIRRGIKKGKLTTIKSLDEISHDVRTGIIHLDDHEKKHAGKLTMAQEAIDSMSFQLAMVGMVYLATFWVTKLLASLLPGDLANTLWSFHFVVALLLSFLTRWFLDKINKSYMIDEGLMNRVSGVAIDYLVVAAIAAISIPILSQYWLSVLLISLFGAAGTVGVVYWTSYRAYKDYHFERFVSVFAEMTGTINSSLTLIRVMDPHFKTSIAEDNIVGSALALPLALPMLIIMNFPTMFFLDNLVKGWWITLGILTAYTLVLVLIWCLTGGLKLKKSDSGSEKSE